MKNTHLIEAIYFSATNTKDSRVKLISHRFEQSIFINYDYTENNIYDMAEKYLISHGFNVIAMGETKRGYAIITDTFKPLKDEGIK